MNKLIGISLLILMVCVITAVDSPRFALATNLTSVLRQTSIYALFGIGVALVIISGGIDLSIGSVVALVGCVLALLVTKQGVPWPLALAMTIGLGLLIGLAHGLLVTKLKIQPFVVTLCGLLVYRGIARSMTGDRSHGFGEKFPDLSGLATNTPFSVPVPFIKWIAEGYWGATKWDESAGKQALDANGQPIPLELFDWVAIPMPFIIAVVAAVLLGIFLNYTVWGRYLLALGRNEEAARYSGIRTDRIVILAYVLCSGLVAVGGILLTLDLNSVQPSTHGSFLELYAIAAAVLGGCSLRGGEGSILGVFLGAALLVLLRNSINLHGYSPLLAELIMGIIILLGVVADETVKRIAARHIAMRQVKG